MLKMLPWHWPEQNCHRFSSAPPSDTVPAPPLPPATSSSPEHSPHSAPRRSSYYCSHCSQTAGWTPPPARAQLRLITCLWCMRPNQNGGGRRTHVTLVAVVGRLVLHAALVKYFLSCGHQLASENLDVLDGLQEAVSEGDTEDTRREQIPTRSQTYAGKRLTWSVWRYPRPWPWWCEPRSRKRGSWVQSTSLSSPRSTRSAPGRADIDKL